MQENPEKVTTNDEAGYKSRQAIEQPVDQLEKKAPHTEAQRSPEHEIIDVLGEINRTDQEIVVARRSITETESKLTALRESIGVAERGEGFPSAGFQNDRIKVLEEEKQKLIEQKDDWIDHYGRMNLPDGIAVEDEEGNLVAKGGSECPEQSREFDAEEKEKDLELRKQWLKKLKESAVERFENAMRSDWRTKDAMNIELTIQLMKLRVPSVIDKKSVDFISGRTDKPPFSTVWMRWDAPSSLDKILNRPTSISKLEIMFDDKAEEIVDSSELKRDKEDKKLSRVAPEKTGEISE